MRFSVKLGVWMLLSLCLCLEAWSATTPQQQLQSISDAVSDGTIREIDILAIPKATVPKSEVTPAILQRDFQCKVILRDLQLTRRGLVRALGNTQASSEAQPVGLRRGVLFVDAGGHVKYSIYLDSFGQGEVNGEKAALSGEFVQWIEDRLPQEYW